MFFRLFSKALFAASIFTLWMYSTMVGEKGLIKGNSVSLMLNCSSEDEIKTLYARLSAEGEATHPLENTFWGALFGGFTDKFGNHWLLHFDRNQ